MSSNVDRLREAIEAFDRGDEGDAGLLAPEFELHQSSAIIECASRRNG